MINFNKSLLFTITFSLCLNSIYAENHEFESRQVKIDTLTTHVKNCIEKAETGVAELPQRILDLPGYSGDKVKHLLYYLAKLPNASYLEIGCFYGSTLIAALYQNTDLSEAIAIDNWSEFGGPKLEFQSNCAQEIPLAPLRFFEADCFAISKDLFHNPINLYFYDGRHQFLDQKQAFTYYDSVLDDVFVAIVDDWNWGEVRGGTLEAFKELNYQVHFAKEITSDSIEKQNWWNGLLIAVIEKPKTHE